MYAAVNQIELSPNGTDNAPLVSSVRPYIGWNIQTLNSIPRNAQYSSDETAPPLPPRKPINSKLTTNLYDIDDNKNKSIDLNISETGKRPLYESVEKRTEVSTYDSELIAFYEMVKRIRLEYKYNDIDTNPGHVIACEFDNHYVEGTEIKLVVHPKIVDDNNSEQGQFDGYGPPIVFTCDSECNTNITDSIIYVKINFSASFYFSL